MSKLIPFLIHLVKNWYTYWVKLLTIIGDIKIYKTPCFVLYNNEEYEYKVRGNEIREICNILQPGDIVLRHYEHYLDSWLIPGYYSHSSIYIGDNTIIHAVAEGVKEIDIIDFCQADGVCILRPETGQEEAIKRAKDYLGKPYDFKFNSIDSSAFYCHELTATCYRELEIPKVEPSFLGVKLKFLNSKYLAESFIECAKLVLVYETKNK